MFHDNFVQQSTSSNLFCPHPSRISSIQQTRKRHSPRQADPTAPLVSPRPVRPLSNCPGRSDEACILSPCTFRPRSQRSVRRGRDIREGAIEESRSSKTYKYVDRCLRNVHSIPSVKQPHIHYSDHPPLNQSSHPPILETDNSRRWPCRHLSLAYHLQPQSIVHCTEPSVNPSHNLLALTRPRTIYTPPPRPATTPHTAPRSLELP